MGSGTLWWSGTPMTWSRYASAPNRRNRSRNGFPHGWRREAWPSTRTRRASSPSIEALTSSGSTSALPQRQAAHQAEQGGRQPDPETAERGGQGPTGSNAEAVISRLNPIIQGWAAYYRSVVPRRRSPPGSLRVAAHLPVGQAGPSEQIEALGHRPVLRHVQPVQRDRWVFGDRDSGYLVKFSWTESSAPDGAGSASPDDPALTTTGPGGGDAKEPRWSRRLARPACAVRLLPPLRISPAHADREPVSPRMGAMVHRDPQSDPPASDRRAGSTGRPGRTRRTPPRARPLRASANRRPSNAGASCSTCTRAMGLLEPCAWKAGTHGSEGAPAR